MQQLELYQRLGIRKPYLESMSKDVQEFVEIQRAQKQLLNAIRNEIKPHLIIKNSGLGLRHSMKHWSEVSHLHLDKDKKRFRCVMNYKKTMANISISYRPSYEVQPTFSMKVDNIITKRGA